MLVKSGWDVSRGAARARDIAVFASSLCVARSARGHQMLSHIAQLIADTYTCTITTETRTFSRTPRPA
eukprot:scaffold3418_cov124-Isochrysis_galbana.AAC.35